jgi:hypothetical protein
MKSQRREFEKSPGVPIPLPAPDGRKRLLGRFELPDKWEQPREDILTSEHPAVQLASWAIFVTEYAPRRRWRKHPRNRPQIHGSTHTRVVGSFIGMLTTYGIPTGIKFGGLPFTLGVPYPKSVFTGLQLNPANDTIIQFIPAIILWIICARALLFTVAYLHVRIQQCVAAKPERVASVRAWVVLFSRLLVCAGFNALGAYVAYRFYSRDQEGPFVGWDSMMDSFGLDGWFAWHYDGAPLTNCLFQVTPTKECINEPALAREAPGIPLSCQTTSWMAAVPYAPHNLSFNTPGWSIDPSSPNYYEIGGIGQYDAVAAVEVQDLSFFYDPACGYAGGANTYGAG